MWAANQNQQYRTVVYSLEATAFIDLNNDQSRFSDIWDSNEGIEWLLARSPEVGMRRPAEQDGIEYWMYSVAADPIAQTRSFLVLYTWDENQVEIIRVKFTDTL